MSDWDKKIKKASNARRLRQNSFARMGLRAVSELANMPVDQSKSKFARNVINPSPVGVALMALSPEVAADGTLDSPEYKKILRGSKRKGKIQR